MPFSANFVKVTAREGKLLVEGLSDPNNVNRIDSMQIAIDTVSHSRRVRSSDRRAATATGMPGGSR